MKIHWRFEWVNLAMLAAMLAAAAWSWSSAGDHLPVHWGASGQPDRYGGRFEALLTLPLMAIALYLLFLALPAIDPGRANYARFSGAYDTVRTAIVAFLAALYGVILASYHGATLSLSNAIFPLLGALFIVLGNLMGKLRPNWFIGVRTPWTLSSKRAWTRTNRIGGWVFIAFGPILAAAGLSHREWAVTSVIIALMASVLALAVYSYLIWRSDPDKTPPAGTLPAEPNDSR
jgi:immunity protein, SdpI family